MTVVKTGVPPAAVPGELLTYNITVANAAGTTAATNTVLTDALPAGETFVSATTTQGTVSTSGNTVTVDLGTLAALTGTADVTIEAFVNSSATGTLSNTASVTSPDDPGSPKTSTAVVTTVNSLPAAAADVSVTATSSPTTGTVGSPETYTLTITNNDPTNTATNVTLTDVLPAGSTFGTGTATGGGTVTQALGVATVTYPTLAPGASQTVTLTATPTTPGVAVNSAAVTTTSGDPNLANNVAVTANPVAGTLTPGVDLSITKTGSPTSGTVGTNETYTLTVTNNSTTTAATGVVVADVLPPGATFVSGTTSVAGVTVTNAAGVATATFPTLAAGASATITIVVTPTAPGAMVDTASVEGAQLDANQTNNVATLVTPVSGTLTPGVDLSITKTGSPTSGTVGSNETYTLTVTNNSTTTAATGVVVADVLPPGATFVSGTSSVAGVTVTNTAGVATATIPTLAAGASATITIVVTPTAPGAMVDTATVEGAQVDTNQTNNVATLVTPVSGALTPGVDLSITKTGSPTSGTVGSNETYTLTVTNNSTTTAATGVVVADVLPPGATFVSGTSSVAGVTVTNTAGVATATIPTLAAGASATITIVVTPTAPGAMVDTASVEGDQLDTNQTNNVATLVTPVGGTITPGVDLSITKTGSPTTGTVGSNETYTLTVTNNSATTAATGVVVADVLPPGATFVSGTSSVAGVTVTNTAGVATATIPTLAAGASATITIVVTPTAPGAMVDTASVEGAELDANQTNNVATLVTPVGGTTTPGVDLSITKTGSPTSGTVGSNETYTLTVTNNSTTTAATGVVVADVLPPGATFVSGTSSVAGVTVTNTAGVATATIPTLAAGASATITIVVTPTAPGAMVDTASVEGAELDTNQTNNVATLVTPVGGTTTPGVDLSITKTGSPTTGTVGSNETYTLTVTNNSTTTGATGVVVADVLPPGATFVSGASSVAGVTVTNTAGVATATIPTLAAGASATITIVVTPTAPGAMVDTASVEATEADTNQTNNVATLVTPVQASGTTGAIDLSITKTGSPTTGTVGSNETYTLTITNNDGTATASGVVVADVLPPTATFVSGTSSVSGVTVTNTAGVASATIPTLAPGASATITIVVTPTVAGPMTDTASVEGAQPDLTQTNNVATLTTTVTTGGASADLSVTKTGPANPVNTGQDQTYTITVTNNDATNSASNVVLTDLLPSGATFVSATSTAGGTPTNSGGTVTANLGTLAAGATDTITVVVSYANAGSFTDTASVTSSTPDNNSANDSASVTSTVQAASNQASVSITKTGSPDPVQVGQSLFYTITVTNSGSVGATGTVVTDTLPAGVTFVSATDTTSGTTLTPIGGVLTDNIGNLAAGATETITIVVTPTAAGTITNSASVATTSPNSSTNTTASFSSTVTGNTPPPGGGHICYLAGDPGDGTDATFVRNLYRELLGRDPDAPGLAFWQSKLQDSHGHSNPNDPTQRNKVIADFLSSEEYREHLVICIYENFLNRAPDTAGLQFWAAKLGTHQALAGGGGSGDEMYVVAAIAGSQEYYLAHGNTDQGFVDGLYQDILGRAADGSGQTFWAHESSLHRDHDAVVRDLLNTTEAHHKLLNADYPSPDTMLPAAGQQAGGSYALAEITGGGWENLYFRGGFGPNNAGATANDRFFGELQGGTPWDAVIDDMLSTQQYYNAAKKGS